MDSLIYPWPETTIRTPQLCKFVKVASGKFVKLTYYDVLSTLVHPLLMPFA